MKSNQNVIPALAEMSGQPEPKAPRKRSQALRKQSKLIIEISDEPIPASDRLTEAGVPESFLYTVSDDVSAVRSRGLEISRFLKQLRGTATLGADNQLAFAEDAKSTLLMLNYGKFVKAAQELSTVSPKDFIGNTKRQIDLEIFRLDSLYSDQFGTYIFEDSMQYPLDEWLRQTDLSGTFYVGGVLRYKL